MESENVSFRKSNEEVRPPERLQQFIDVFSGKGWLNRPVRIIHHNKKYRLLCSENQFIAFRINDNWGIPPGIPGWIVCIIDFEQIIQDSDFSPFDSDEPDSYDWLRILHENDFVEF
jgi:hypothetical protein